MHREAAADQEDRQEAPGRVAEPRPVPVRVPVLLEMMSPLLRVAEIIALLLSAAICMQLAGDALSAERTQTYVSAILGTAVFYAFVAELTGSYDLEVRFSHSEGWRRLLIAWSATFVFLVAAAFFLKMSEQFSRIWLASWFASGLVLVGTVRTGGVFLLSMARRRGYLNQRVVIFGTDEQGTRLARYIQGSERLTIDLLGLYDDRQGERLSQTNPDLPFRGSLTALLSDIRRGEIDQVIVALPWSQEARIQQIVNRLAVTPVRIRLAPDLVAYHFAKRPVVLLDSVPLLTLFERPISGMDQLVKRGEDLLLGGLITILATPIMLLVALLIRLDSPGPVLFRQPREGFNNGIFWIYKFRSMHTALGQSENIVQATRHDPRVTRVGRFLRRTSLDELPQLLNVLKGEMSLVGPRPHAPTTKAGERVFSEVLATYAARHRVKPGMTGWAQVSGWRGETDTEEKLIARVDHDLHYIENWSVAFDVYILFRTAGALLAPTAY